MAIKFVSILSLTLFVGACGKAPDMPTFDGPNSSVELLDSTDQRNFYSLPLQGAAKDGTKFWSGDYWALNKGSINIRWNTEEKIGFDLYSPPKEELEFWTTDDIATLAATEKFDLLMGRYHYPLVAEASAKANIDAEYWEGICNGWAPASINYNEPTPKTLINPDGIAIPFGSSDIKALISYYYAYVHKEADTQQIGKRCPRTNGWFNWNRDCKNDLDPGSFHVVLGNRIGMKKRAFLADIERFKEVWNHPIIAYRSEIMGEDPMEFNSTPGTAKIVRVKTVISYVDESDNNTWGVAHGTSEQVVSTREYEYNLFLNHKNEITGGKWKSKERPDFLWIMGPTKGFEGHFAGLERLLN